MLPLSGVTHMTPQEEVAENLLLARPDATEGELRAAVAPGRSEDVPRQALGVDAHEHRLVFEDKLLAAVGRVVAVVVDQAAVDLVVVRARARQDSLRGVPDDQVDQLDVVAVPAPLLGERPDFLTARTSAATVLLGTGRAADAGAGSRPRMSQGSEEHI